jgi:hypothetical protein
MSDVPNAPAPNAAEQPGVAAAAGTWDYQLAVAWDTYAQAALLDSPLASTDADEAGSVPDPASSDSGANLDGLVGNDASSTGEDPLAMPDELWGVADADGDVGGGPGTEAPTETGEWNIGDDGTNEIGSIETISDGMADLSSATRESWNRFDR